MLKCRMKSFSSVVQRAEAPLCARSQRDLQAPGLCEQRDEELRLLQGLRSAPVMLWICVCMYVCVPGVEESALTRYRTVGLAVSPPSLSHLHMPVCFVFFLSDHFLPHLWMEPQDAVSNNWALYMQGLAPCLSMQLSDSIMISDSQSACVNRAFVWVNFHI